MVDQTGTLAAGDIASLTQTLKDLETRKGSQIAVLIVPTTDGEAIEQYSLRVAEAWKIGRKKIDDGALLVIAKNDRRLRIEVGYGLEGALTDATTKRIIDEDITPKFKAGDFAGGVSAGVDRMVRVINGEKLPEPEPPHWQDSQSFDPVSTRSIRSCHRLRVHCRRRCCGALLGRLLGSAGDRRLRRRLLAWFLVGSLGGGGDRRRARLRSFVAFSDLIAVRRRPRHAGQRWSGGPAGSGGSVVSSSGSSSGGFSGGGGSFGGGGASGSW